VPDEIHAAEQGAILRPVVPFGETVPDGTQTSARALTALRHGIPERDEIPHEARL
jgi:hypothetical protein